MFISEPAIYCYRCAALLTILTYFAFFFSALHFQTVTLTLVQAKLLIVARNHINGCKYWLHKFTSYSTEVLLDETEVFTSLKASVSKTKMRSKSVEALLLGVAYKHCSVHRV